MMRTKSLRFASLGKALLLLVAAAAAVSASLKDEPAPIFNGVKTEFRLTRSRIKQGQSLQVHVTIRNTTNTTKVFNFVYFGVNARLYSNGQLLEDLCEPGQVPVQSLTLAPGELWEVIDDVATPTCYKLEPGRYSIRFNYNLGVIQDAALRKEYQQRYGMPKDDIVPWDGRDHPFKVVE